jgi:hypothetical protein
MTPKHSRTLKAGARAVGALAIGAVAFGALAIGALAIGRARIKRLEVDELMVGNFHIRKRSGTDEPEPPMTAGTKE